MSVASFDRGHGPVSDVCLIVEGCYPHMTGGVSGWLDWLMRSLPEVTFSVVSIVSGAGPRESKYAFADNLVRFRELDLQGPPPTLWPLRKAGAQRDRDELAKLLVSFSRRGSLGEYAAVMRHVAPPGGLTYRDLTQSRFSWHLVCEMYAQLMPHASFLDFFWAWRSLLGGMFAVMTAPLPAARVYHTISTGYAGLMAARAALETGRPACITEHGIYTNERRIEILMADWIVDTVDRGLSLDDPRADLRDLWVRMFESYARTCYEACDAITTLYGDNQSIQVALGADPDKLMVIANGIDLERFRKVARAASSHPPTIALIGRVVPIKDVKTFIAAAAMAAPRIPGLRALVIGPTDEDEAYAEECRTLVGELGLEACVTFTGRVDVSEWLGVIDIVILTSLSEAQPLTLLEAGAAGVACITTNAGSCREILLGRADEEPPLGAGGIVTDLVSPEQIADGIIKLIEDAPLRKAMGERLRRRVERFYPSDLSRDAYRGLYGRLMGRERRPQWQA